MLLNPYVLLPFGKVHNPSRLSRESASERPKMARTYPVFNFFTSKCASCHNGVHFFDVSTSKVAPTQRCLVHFDFQTRFWPQRHTLLRHLNFQKWSDVEELCYILTSKICFAPQRRAFFHHFSSFIWQCRSALLSNSPEPQSSGTTQCFATFLFLRACAFFFFRLLRFHSSLF